MLGFIPPPGLSSVLCPGASGPPLTSIMTLCQSWSFLYPPPQLPMVPYSWAGGPAVAASSLGFLVQGPWAMHARPLWSVRVNVVSGPCLAW